ncbi:MAG: nucleotide sugar dehydrogenase [Methanocellales archaeon]|nr:nucleotide sugar dehydrogenase [Methanocellales archaeon]MDD5446386.1 nucleotide sugar dehydrogenase [Methanocellales archaeon]
MEKEKIAIMGMGYVGLTLSVVLAKNGFEVYGIEIEKEVVENLKKGEPHFHEKRLKAILRQQLRLNNLKICESFPNEKIDIYIICVGTPLKKESKTSNIDYIRDVVLNVAGHMKRGSLIILRSTIPVGTSRSVVLHLLEKQSGLKAGKDFYFAFAPERTIEGNAILELETNPQIIGGFDERSVTLASDLFRKLTPTVINVSSLEASEMIKILDNTYRDTVFAYANEIAMICEKLNLDATELINAANTHYSRNNIPNPSPGVGGACLSKDPHILIDFAKRAGYDAKIIKESRRINEYIPIQIVSRIKAKLEEFNKNIRDAKIFIVGFAFKGEPETSDMRDSTTLLFLDELKKYASDIHGFDPVVDNEQLKHLGIKVCETMGEGYSNADVILFLNNHRYYLDLEPFEICSKMNKPAIFYDAWRMFEKELFKNIEGIHYMGVGL